MMHHPPLPIAGSIVMDNPLSPESTWHGMIELDNTVLTLLWSRQATIQLYHFTRQPAVVYTRGALAVVGVFFAFASVLDLTPRWTSFIYLFGLAPEIVFTSALVDVVAMRKLVVEFEFLIIVISMIIFAVMIAIAMSDARAVVPLTIALVGTFSSF